LNPHEFEVVQCVAAGKKQNDIGVQPSIAQGAVQTDAKAVAGKNFGEPRKLLGALREEWMRGSTIVCFSNARNFE
jgi:DNA-binding NarL/FixJ family response regulator